MPFQTQKMGGDVLVLASAMLNNTNILLNYAQDALRHLSMQMFKQAWWLQSSTWTISLEMCQHLITIHAFMHVCEEQTYCILKTKRLVV